jgi:hypothetical protein
MKHSKNYYRSLSCNGYEWGGEHLPGIHFFVYGNNRDGFKEMLIDEDGLTNGDLQFMTKHGLTLTEKEAKKRSKAFIRKNFDKEEAAHLTEVFL